MKAIYMPTNEIVDVEGLSESGVFTRVSFNGSSQFVATGQLAPLPDKIPKSVAENPSVAPIPAANPPSKSPSPKAPDEVSLFLREMETEDDLRSVCKDIGIDYPVRPSMGLTKMAIGNSLRKLIKNGEYELSWT